MAVFSNILRAFERENIRDTAALEAALARYGESGRRSISSGSPSDEDNLVRVLTERLIWQKGEFGTFYDRGGIQQFSLSETPSIARDDVKKALFLSNIATIFTEHHAYLDTEHNWNSYDSMSDSSESWGLDHDYIRDLFEYREAISAGDLVIVPKRISKTTTTNNVGETMVPDGTDTEYVNLLEEINRTQILAVPPSSLMIDKVIDKYRQSKQLVSLPILEFPWVSDLTVPNLLKIKEDHGDLLWEFQHAYHDAILDYIENHNSLDYAKISSQINNDVVKPELRKIRRKYKKLISTHRSLAVVGSSVSALSIVGIVVSATVFNKQIQLSDIESASSIMTGLIAALAANKIYRDKAISELDDNSYYILWKVTEGR